MRTVRYRAGSWPLLLILSGGGCSGSLLGDEAPPMAGDGGSGGGADGSGGTADPPAYAHPDDLETATGCDGPFNAGQLLTYHITTGGNFTGIEQDDYGPGTFACGDEAPIRVGVRVRGAGEGWKIDFDWADAAQEWRTLKKLSLHTGAGGSPATEYLSWRVQRLGGGHIQRSALARVMVNGRDEGVLFNLEQVNKRFLRSRLGDDSGWLFKQSGSVNDGYRTNETMPNPYEAQWCIFDNAPCPPPVDLETWLPRHLAIEQLMRMGAINAILGDSDGPIAKSNNFYRYDYAAGPRYYWPWDFDSAWTHDLDMFPTGSGVTGESSYHAILFTYWADDYDALITALLAGPLSVASVSAELDRAVEVAPSDLGASQVEGMKAWYTSRHAAVQAELDAH